MVLKETNRLLFFLEADCSSYLNHFSVIEVICEDLFELLLL